MLPSGDVGMWSTLDSATSAACASAQLDARMDGVSMRVNTGLMTLASLINVASAAGKSLPAVGSTVDLLAEMNAALPAVTFTSASIARPFSGSYTYRVEFSFTDGSATRKAEIRLTHAPGGSPKSYSGLLTYAVTRGNADMQNCPAPTGGTIDIGSLNYERTSATSMTLVHREGNYCGDGTLTPLASSYANFLSDGQLDPAGKLVGSKGWANNFNRFGAAYDPTTLKGNYAFGWQAGFADPLFALAATLAFIVLYDASGVRRNAGLIAARVNALPTGLWADPAADAHGKPLKETLGHTRLEVLIGSLLGPAIALPGLVLLGSPLQLAARWGLLPPLG